MRIFLTVLELLGATACRPPKTLINISDPARDLSRDKLTCDSYATQQRVAYYPVITLQNAVYAKSTYDLAFNQCLTTLGWFESPT